MTIDAGLTAIDGQTLGYTWGGMVENWHRTAFTSFGDGHGVWEAGGGSVLPFYSRNLFGVKQWAAPLAPDNLMPTIRALTPAFGQAPSVDPVNRKLGLTNDRIQSHGLDVAKALGAKGTGLVWAAVENGASIANAKRSVQPVRASLVQVTNLGVTVKDSPQNTLVFVTRLDNAAPVGGAKVSIINRDNSMHWSGTTGADGVATGPGIPHRERRYTGEDDYAEWQKPDFVVIAEKDGDIAYVGSNWNEGIQPWDFGVPFNRSEAEPMLRGTVFSDRGVYRLGEEVHFKAILRQNTPSGIRLLRSGTPRLHLASRQSESRSSTSAPSPSTSGAAPSGRRHCRARARSVTTRCARCSRATSRRRRRPRKCSRATSRAPSSTTRCRTRRRSTGRFWLPPTGAPTFASTSRSRAIARWPASL